MASACPGPALFVIGAVWQPRYDNLDPIVAHARAREKKVGQRSY
jgi:hypothetical protein